MSTFHTRKTSTQRVRFENSRGLELAGLLERPAQTPRLFAVVAHCFTCTKDFPAVARIARALADTRIAVLRFDFTGLGNSSGTFAESNFSSCVDDLLSAAGYLKEHELAPALLVGHSWGGAACLAAAESLAELKAVATLGTPSTPAHVLEHFPRESRLALEHGSAQIAIAGRSCDLTRQFVEDLEQRDFDADLKRFDKALLILHSPEDSVVTIDHAQRIYAAVRGPRSFIALPDADHVLSERRDTDYAAAMIGSWVSRYE